MEAAALVTTFLSPFLPHLLKLGDPVAEASGQQLGEQLGGRSWSAAKRVWSHLTPKLESRSIALGAATALAIDPTDQAAHTALSVQLELLLSAEPSLAAALLNRNSEGASRTTGLTPTVTSGRHHTAREHRHMGDIATATGHWSVAVQWYKRAIKVSLSSNDPRGASTAYSRLAQVYLVTERGQEMISTCLSALALDMEHNEDLIGFNIHILAQLLNKVGIDEFQCLWQAVIAAPCPAQLLELTQQASQSWHQPPQSLPSVEDSGLG